MAAEERKRVRADMMMFLLVMRTGVKWCVCLASVLRCVVLFQLEKSVDQLVKKVKTQDADGKQLKYLWHWLGKVGYVFDHGRLEMVACPRGWGVTMTSL